MSGEPGREPAGAPTGRQRLSRGNRWSYTTVLVGGLLAAVQVVHIKEMLEFGLTGVVLEGVIPLVFAAGLALSGPWLHHRGYTRPEQKRVVVWMGVVAAVSGLLFLWAVSHQLLVADPSATGASSAYGGSSSGSGGVFPHAMFVTFTNLTAGGLVGLVLGVYNVRSRRHYRAVQREREQVAHQRARLSVLNRVLRHNLRNEATIIMGNAREIASRTEGTLADRAETVAERTAGLVGLGEKARQIDETIGDEVEYADVDLGSTLHTLADSTRQRDVAVECAVDTADTVGVRTNENILDNVLQEAVDNAVEHRTDEPVRLRLGARRRPDGGVDVTVADDGPGIPEQERRTLDSTEETALEHTSGLGLWLVNWGAMALGGDVAFEDNEQGGTTVRVGLPATPADRPAFAAPGASPGSATGVPGSVGASASPQD